MIIRAISATGDWQFGKGKQDYLSGNLAIAENIQTRLYEFLNDAFWNMNSGLDWTRLLGTPGTQQEITLSCRSVILQSYGVVAVNSISTVYNSTTRSLLVSFSISTIYTTTLSINFQMDMTSLLGG